MCVCLCNGIRSVRKDEEIKAGSGRRDFALTSCSVHSCSTFAWPSLKAPCEALYTQFIWNAGCDPMPGPCGIWLSDLILPFAFALRDLSVVMSLSQARHRHHSLPGAQLSDSTQNTCPRGRAPSPKRVSSPRTIRKVLFQYSMI